MSRWLLALLVGLLLFAPAEATASEPPLGAVLVNPRDEDLVFPGAASAYAVSAWEVTLAQDYAIRTCMVRKGYDHRLPPQLPRRPHKVADAGLFGLNDLQQAAAHGYHLAPDPQLSAAIHRRFSFRQPDDSPRAHRAQRRCALATGRWLGTNRHWRLVNQWQLSRYGDTDRDSRAVATNGAWSDCMAEAGYHYATWDDANDDPRWWQAARPSAVEKAAAVADVTCRHETNLVGILYAVELAYYEQIMAGQPGLLDSLDASAEQILAISRRVIARNNPLQPR